MNNKVFEDRRKSLEEQFFNRENQRLLENLRQIREKEQSREALAQASGIRDEGLLDRLLELNVRAETVAALSLVPLVAVVWADGYLDEKEQEAIRAAALQNGLQEGDDNFRVLESWLERRPSSQLLETWKQYLQGLCQNLSPEEREALKTDLLERARSLAEVSGGILDLAFKISKAEHDKLEELEAAFEGL